MRKLLTSTLLATAAASAVVLAGSPASAATFRVTGANADGSATGDAATTTLTTPNASLTCTSAHTDVSSLDNGDQNGTPIANIDSLTFDGCSLSFIQFEVTTNASPGTPWALNALSEDAGIVQGEISAPIVAHVHGLNAPCEADVVGNVVPGTYDNGSGTLSIPGTGQDLTIANVSQDANCASLINNGDAASFAGDFFVDPPVVIDQIG